MGVVVIGEGVAILGSTQAGSAPIIRNGAKRA